MSTLFELTLGFYPQILMSFAVSAALCWFIITRFFLSPLAQNMVADTQAKQAMHRQITPRIGGVAILVSFTLVFALNVSDVKQDLLAVILAASVIFIAGLKEDIYRDVSPKYRLLAAFVSAGAAIYFSGSMITHLDLPGEKAFLANVGLWVIVTLVWSAGTCHALNLIDGLNGLASGYTIVALLALSLIAAKTGEPDIIMIALILTGALLGFYVFNWPFGKIFLGDAGAYTLGHIVAWLGIILSSRNPELSPLALLLILFWPVADTVFAMARRLIYRRAIGQPDRFHFHHIVVRVVARLSKGRLSHTLTNSTATLIMYPIMLGPALLGVAFWNKPVHALVALLVCIVAFMASYIVVVDLLAAGKLRRRRTKSNTRKQDLTPAFERSRFSGIFIEECLAVEVLIKRQDTDSEWTLEAIADQAPGRSWAETFKTDVDAWSAFMTSLERDGIEAILGIQSRPARAFHDNPTFH